MRNVGQYLGLFLQLLNGRVEDDEIPEEYCGLEGSTVQEQLTIVSSRLDQREAEYDSLKTELNKTKEECINLQGLFSCTGQPILGIPKLKHRGCSSSCLGMSITAFGLAVKVSSKVAFKEMIKSTAMSVLKWYLLGIKLQLKPGPY